MDTAHLQWLSVTTLVPDELIGQRLNPVTTPVLPHMDALKVSRIGR